MRPALVRARPNLPVRLLLPVAAAAVVAAATIGVAFGSTTVKKFDASISAPSRPTAAAQTYTFTLKNQPASNQAFGSANITVPSGYGLNVTSFTQTVAGGAKSWLPPAYDAATRTIKLRSPDARNSVAPSQALLLTFSATASCTVSTGPWLTDVRQSNQFLGTFNDFVGASPSLAVTSTASTRFRFDAIGTIQAVGRAFAVRVTATDECGQAADFDGTGLLSGLGGIAPRQLQFTDGVATTTLTPVQTQDDAQLSVDGASDPSNTFDVVTAFCTSDDPSEICEASDDALTTTVTTARPPSGATLALDFSGLETSFVCDGQQIATRGAVAVITPDGYTQPITLTNRWDKNVAPGTGVANFVFCMSKDGISFVVVPPCTRAGGLPAGKPFCELKRNRNGVGDLLIQYVIAPNDPWGGLG